MDHNKNGTQISTVHCLVSQLPEIAALHFFNSLLPINLQLAAHD